MEAESRSTPGTVGSDGGAASQKGRIAERELDEEEERISRQRRSLKGSREHKLSVVFAKGANPEGRG